MHPCVHEWFDVTRVFCFCTHGTHVCHTHVSFKLWVIWTVHTSAELISPGEDPTVYGIGDNYLVKRTTKEYVTIDAGSCSSQPVIPVVGS